MMLVDVLQERASCYVSGAMTAPERDSFDVILAYHEELRAHVAALEQGLTSFALAQAETLPATPSHRLRDRILHDLPREPARCEPEALVVTDPAGRIEWVNPAFTAMCGYDLAELRGRKPGVLLQGPETDPAAVARIRAAVHARQACHETLVNYHKDGRPYRADVRIAPVLDEAGEPLWFVARERLVSDTVRA